jgi:polyisoprenoid-binding protein YceI
MSRRIFDLLATASLVALLAASALPQNSPGKNSPAASPPAATGSTTWKIDATHSVTLFRVQHFGAGMFWGRFDSISGTVTTSGTPIDSLAFNVTIDANSVSTANKDRDNHLRSPDFFNVKEFPQMTFVSSGSKKTGATTWEVSGNLTLHGVTKPITAQVECTGQSESPNGKRAGFEAVFTIDRGDFGVTYGIDKNAVGKDVRVTVGLEAISQ